MSHPEIVEAALDDEPVAAEVPLGGDDALYVTQTRTLIYRAEGILSDESVEEYPHGAERITVSEGRRKSTVALDYGLDGEQSFSLPTKRLDQALHPVVAGVLNAADITDPGETVRQTFRFSELTLVITSDRLVKHIGAAVWDEDFEEFHFDDVTDLDFEDGSVATSVVLTIGGGRQERFKTPNDDARAVREALESALLAYHDAPSLEAFRESMAPEEAEPTEKKDVDFGGGLDPLSTNPGELSNEPTNATRSGEDGEQRDADDAAPGGAAGTTSVDAGTGDPAATDAGAGEPAGSEVNEPTGAAGGSDPLAADETDPTAAEADPIPTEQPDATAAEADPTEGGRTAGAAGSDGVTGEATDPTAVGGGETPDAGGRNDVDGEALTETVERSAAAGGEGEQPGPMASGGAMEDEDGRSFADTGFESAESLGRKELAAELAALREVVEAQGQQLQRQSDLIDQLIEELRQGR